MIRIQLREAAQQDRQFLESLRQLYRQGLGTEAARLLLAQFPGLWQINKRTYNPPAMAFWGRVAPAVSAGDCQEHIAIGDIHMHILRVAG